MNCSILIAALLATAVAEKQPEEKTASPFYTLPQCAYAEGMVEVRMPGSSQWTEAEEGLHYPLGAAYRTQLGGEAKIAFGEHAVVSISGDSSFETRAQPLGQKSRTIVPTSGTIEVSLPTELEHGLFQVTTPALTVRDTAGNSKYEYRPANDGFDLTVRCVTGSLSAEGRHFKIPLMRAADEFRMRSSHDNLVSVLYGKSGDYVISLDRGLIGQPTFTEEGAIKYVYAQQFLSWHLSVGTRVQINRMKMSDGGDRLGVSVLTFDTVGQIKNHYAFTETRYENNTGELVAAPTEEEDTGKRASETTEDVAADVEEDEVAEESSSKEASSEESSEDSSSDDSSDDSSGDSDDEDEDF